MADSTALEIVTAYQEAWTKRDFEMAGRYVAEDIVFHSPQQHITSAREFLSMLSAFAERIDHRWEKLEATTDGDNVLILYNLFLDSVPATCADFFTVATARFRAKHLCSTRSRLRLPPTNVNKREGNSGTNQGLRLQPID